MDNLKIANQACGLDLITGFLLKRIAEVLASSLSCLFNKSLSLPRDWVTANVVSIFKHDYKSVVNVA